MTQAASVAQAEVSRELSPLERWYWICDQVSPLNVIAHARLRGPVSPDSLCRGLDALQRRHPMLNVAIAADPDGANPRYAPTGGARLSLRRVTVPAGEADTAWERELRDTELVQPVCWQQGPLARAVVISWADTGGGAPDGQDLLLTLTHCIADGITAMSLLRQWIELAAECDADPAAVPVGRREPARPAPEDMFPPHHRGVAGAARMRRQQRRGRITARRRNPRRLQASVAVPFSERRTRLLHRALSPDQLHALTAACRREGATVHGALAAAMVTAVARDAGAGPGYFTIGSPIDIRRDLVPPVSGQEMGTYVATVPSVVAYRPGQPLWPAARAISRDLARRRRRGEPLSSMNRLRQVSPQTLAASTPFLRFMDEKGPITLCLSNIGRYDFPDAIGPWPVSCGEFIASLSVNGLFVATVNTSHERLAWNFTYVDRAIPDDRAERLAAGSVAAVLSAIGQVPE